MSEMPEQGFSIGVVSAMTGLTTHTLRFYEKEGLFLEPIQRDAAGRRRFSNAQIDWIRIGGKLRTAGMPLPEIRRYAEAARNRTDAAAIQLQLLRHHKKRVRAQLADVEHLLQVITDKIAHHQNRTSPIGDAIPHHDRSVSE